MSKNTIFAAIADYRAGGGQFADLAPLVMQAWEAAAPPPNPDAWLPQGITPPDADGLIRIREVEEFRAQMEKEGRHDVADQIRSKYACRPGLDLCLPGTKAYATVVTATSTAQFMLGMGLAGGWQVYPAVPTGDPLRPYDVDRSAAIAGAYAIPANLVSLSTVVDYIKRNALAIAAGPLG